MQWSLVWTLFFSICAGRLWLTLNISPKMTKLSQNLFRETFWVVLFVLFIGIVIFISVIGTYLVSLLFFGKEIKNKTSVKNLIYGIYLCSYGTYNLCYFVFLLIMQHDISSYQRQVGSLVLALLISLLIITVFKRYRLATKKVIIFSILVFLINSMLPLYAILIYVIR